MSAGSAILDCPKERPGQLPDSSTIRCPDPLCSFQSLSFPLAPFFLPDVKHSCFCMDSFLQMKSLPLAVLSLPEGPGCRCIFRYWGGSYRGEQLALSTWVSGAEGLLTQCPVPLVFLQMCVPGMFFLVESHFAISCPVPGCSAPPPTPLPPYKKPWILLSSKSFLSRQQCLSGARNLCTSCLAPIALLERDWECVSITRRLFLPGEDPSMPFLKAPVPLISVSAPL